MSEVLFTSKNGKYSVTDGKTTINFAYQNKDLGMYRTKDENEIAFLRNYPAYGKDFFEAGGMPSVKEDNIVQGTRSAETAAKLGEAEARDIQIRTAKQLVEKFKRYDELKPKVMKLDGSLRKDAIGDEIKEFEELAAFLGLSKQPEIV